jgi:hypothetical protein
MAVCNYCKHEMQDRVSCTLAEYNDIADVPPLLRIPYGREPRKFPNDPDPWPIRDAEGFEAAMRFFESMGQRPEWTVHAEGCRDCGTPSGGLHHPGCDVEDCPNCGMQAIACDCGSTGEDE